ncbi:hypothetical protein Slin15195_G045110 [Septoria linicola]|uniref:Uncharacterized protein n=1 Tax=Septoria linicola TaxID=215465 RepID=A0A9Q9ASG8_9PEZI|nr:hypothetical protein Slin14017_G048630 [Septoria linicola]USW51192.1 hypothetical protein Slin15195_G045110 [Septoria linicola]
MKSPLLALAFTVLCEARIYNRQGPRNGTSTITSSMSTNSPASIAAAGPASTTSATHATSSISTTTTYTPKNETNGCCYIYPRAVGINTWWTSSVDVTVATVITTWLQYNNTIVPGNVTTKTVINATEIFGAHQVQSLDYTLQPVSATATKTDWVCGGWAPYSSGTAPCTSTISTTRTYSALSTAYYNTSNVLSGVPNSLLPANAVLYGKTSIDSTTATTFPSQRLIIEAPTPYYLFPAIDLFTSETCMGTKTTTNYTSYMMTTINGAATQVSSVYPIATVTGFDGASPINPGRSGNLYLNYTIAKPFPDGDYSDFNFTDWANGVIMGPAPGSVDAYMFRLPDDFPEFLAGIPEIRSEYPEIASCTNFAGDGEPTVHVPVNQLTDTSHVTMTMNGALRPPAGSPKPEPVVTTTKDRPPQFFTEIPVIETTADELETPGPEISRTLEVTKPGTTLDVPSHLTPPIAFSPVTGHSQDELATPEPKPHVSVPPKMPQIAKPDTALDTPETASHHTTQKIGDVIASVIGLVPQPGTTPAVQTDDVPRYTSAPKPVVTLDGTVISGDDKTEFILGGQTLAPGESAITIGDNTLELPAGGTAVVVNGHTSPIVATLAPNNRPAPKFTFGDDTITTNAATEFVIASRTLTPGGQAITLAGTTLSVASDASAVVINGHSSAIAVPAGVAISIGNALATPLVGGAYLLPGDKTLSPGANGLILAGTTYSLAEDGRSVIANGATSTLPSSSGFSASLTELILPGATLLPGHEAVISGMTYSLPTTGDEIYINGRSSRLPAAEPDSPMTLPNGVVATQSVVSNIVIDSQTLVPGGNAITVSGTTYSASGTEVIVVASGKTMTRAIDDIRLSTAVSSSKTKSPSSSRNTASASQTESASSPLSTGGTTTLGPGWRLSTLALGVALAVILT